MVPPRPPSVRGQVGNGCARAFLMRYTRCNVCIAREVNVHVRFQPPGNQQHERLLGSEGVFGVHDAVAIALLGEEPLPVGGEVGVDRVTSDHGVEARRDPLRLGSQ
jgi:hypothetical protein